MGNTMTATEPETTGNGDSKGASVIVNAIAVLRTFTADEPLLGVTEIANRVGLHKSTWWSGTPKRGGSGLGWD